MAENTDRLLGQLVGELSQARADVRRVGDSVSGMREDLSEVRENVAALRTRQEDHTGRINLLEQGLGEQRGHRAKLIGIYVGAAGVLALLGAALGFLLKAVGR